MTDRWSRGKTIEALDTAVFAVLALCAFSLTVGIALTQISLFVAIVLWLAKCAVARRWLGFATPLDKWFGLYLAACIVATICSVRPADSAIALKKFYLITPVYLLPYALKDIRQVKALVALFLAGAALTAGYGLVKYLRGIDGRLLGTQPTAMHSGGIYMMAGLLALSLLIGGIAGRRSIWKLILAAAAVIIMLGLVLTKTISAWFSWLTGMTVTLWHRRWAAVTTLALIAALAVTLVALRTTSAGFFTVDKSGSWQVRTNLWRMGWQLFQRRPITGYGMISLQDQYRDIPYDNPHWQEAKQTGHLHNNFVQIAVTAGVIGLAAFVLLWIAIFKALALALKGSDAGTRPYAAGFLACATGFMVNGLAEYNFGASVPVTVIWFIVGLALALQRLATAVPGNGPTGRERDHGGAGPCRLID